MSVLQGSCCALVQAKQFFYNEDNWLVRYLGSDNKIFYYLIMPALNGMGIASCVGTGYVMQRKALDSVGGYIGGYAVVSNDVDVQ